MRLFGGPPSTCRSKDFLHAVGPNQQVAKLLDCYYRIISITVLAVILIFECHILSLIMSSTLARLLPKLLYYTCLIGLGIVLDC